MENNNEKKVKVLQVHWNLHLMPYHQKKQVLGDLKMPANLSSRYRGEGIRPPVLLELFDEHQVKPDDNDEDKQSKSKLYEDKLHSLNIMRDTATSGILHARLVLDGNSPLLQCLEPYDGNLADYLNSKNLGIPEFVDTQTEILLPTHNLSSAFSQIVDQIEFLRICGNYHGNFKLRNTRYIINEMGALVLKLSDFKRKSGKRSVSLAADWYSVADALVEVLKIAKKLNAEPNKYPRIITCQLEGLIQFLRDIGSSNAALAFKSIKRQPFFWGKAERKVFFIYTIPLALRKRQFVSSLKNAKFIPVPWGRDGFDGFLTVMNDYRKGRGQENYKTDSRKDFVQFISGLYTHEEQIKALLKVDVALQKRQPKLCYQLYTLLPGSIRTMDT